MFRSFLRYCLNESCYLKMNAYQKFSVLIHVCVSAFACGKLDPRLVKLKGDWLLYMIFAKQVGSLQKGRDNVPIFHKILFNRILLSQNECVSKVFSANSCVCACLFVVS